ncbi:cellulase family glycosylhydrolase [Candidatus Bipolaricaulota bacterium]|nr:cellulase family glycosylhydrolase [Candidatus Bipolaricaulota bacterium]
MKDQDSDETCGKFTRRDFLKATIAGSSALVAPTIIDYLGQSTTSSDKEFLEIRDGNFYRGGEEYVMKGANYLSRDNPWRVIKRFDPEKVDKELKLAENLGINTIRTGINYVYSIGRDRIFDDSGQYTGSPRVADIDEGYFENFDKFLDIADSHGIKVMPILFDHAYWELYEPDFWDVGKSYLEQWFPEFKDDERIIAWDVKNEPDVYSFFPEGSDRKLLDFLEEMIDYVGEIDEIHPTTVGWKSSENLKYGLRTDYCSFHHYDWPRKLEGEIEQARDYSTKPLVLSEFGRATLEESKTNPNYSGNEESEEQYYKNIFSEGENLSGFYFWRLFDNPQELTKQEGMGYVYDKDANDNFKDYELHFGVFRTDYSKKPAAHVVEQYYKWIL